MTPDPLTDRAWNARGGWRAARSLAGRWGPPAYLLLSVGFLGCATLGGGQGQALVPSRYVTRTGPFAVYSHAPVGPESSAVRALWSLEGDVAGTLGLRADAGEPPVDIYVLKDREAFTHFLTFYYPELPPRRAFFLAQGPKRVVYTFNNDRLDEDLRHEAAHALLHATVGDLPLWLDEGLAEYFEGPTDRRGVNPEHLARLPDDLKAGWRPDLARLEALKTVRDMSPRDYRESWAWVHYLLNDPGPGRAALLGYLADLRSSAAGKPETLSARLDRLDRGAGPHMLAHVERVRSAPEPPPALARPSLSEPTILLQNSPIDAPARASTPAAAPPRSLFGRILGLVGLGGRPS